MSIKRYSEKRDFKQTPEPAGNQSAAGDTRHLRFVIQKHQASHLHYDFRLEMDGVLKSWAVPKGPSLNPKDKRLAMAVEDHPMDYRLFEGIIPKGNYGAGTVLVWDEGTYHVDPDLSREDNESALLKAYNKGKLTFQLCGSKLHGEFSLVKMRGDGKPDNGWLLIKARDEAAQTEGDIREQDESVLSQRSMEEIANDKDAATWKSNREDGSNEEPAEHSAQVNWAEAALAIGGKEAALPQRPCPQLATLVDAPFDRKGWLFEIKWDGYRALGVVSKRRRRLISRNGKTFDKQFPVIHQALHSLPCDVIVDGEICALDEEGTANFSLLQNYEKNAHRLVYYLFDLLYIDGVDIRTAPLRARKELLQHLLQGRDERLRYSDHVDDEGEAFFQLTRQRGLEGMIAKDGASAYQDGKRSRHWLKVKSEQRQEFVIAGYTQPRNTRSDIGSLVLAYFDQHEKLQFAGHVGSGLNADTRKELRGKLDRLQRKTSPFGQPPATNEAPTWVTPKLVCEVRYTEKTEERHLRHPVFLGLRSDKDPKAIRWEVEADADAITREAEAEDSPPTAAKDDDASQADKKPRRKSSANGTAKKFTSKAPQRTDKTSLKVGGHEVSISHPQRIHYPELKLSKLDVIDYYQSIAQYLLPHLKDRPMVLHRFPNGVSKAGFYQKDNPQDLPDYVESIRVHSRSSEENINYLLCQNEASLAYLVNLGCQELNPWNSRTHDLDKPDWMIFDLDPVEIAFAKVVETAQIIHDILGAAGIDCYCKTSGKRGLHVAVPLGGQYHNDTVRHLAESIASLVHQEAPKFTSLERSPSKRKKKVYLDYLQNGFGKTLACAYSMRPVEYAGVSTPLHWDEINRQLDPREFTWQTVPKRLEKQGDLWEPVIKQKIDLEKLLH